MAVVASDIKLYLSPSGNSNPNAALGGTISATEVVTSPTLNNLFDNVSGTEANAGDTEYRGIYVKNTNGSDTASSVKVAVPSQVSGGASIEIGLDAAGVGDGASTGVMTTIANESTAPGSVSFSAPTTDSGGLSIGDLDAAEVHGLWFKRTVAAGTTALSADGVTLRVYFD